MRRLASYFLTQNGATGAQAVRWETGAGGSIAFAHPERELAFAYTMNRMSSGLAGYDRADTLIAATLDVLDRV